MGACSSLARTSFPVSEGLVLKVPLQPLDGWLCWSPDKQSLIHHSLDVRGASVLLRRAGCPASWLGPSVHLSSREEVSTVFAETCSELFFCRSSPYTLPGWTRLLFTCASVSFSPPLRMFQWEKWNWKRDRRGRRSARSLWAGFAWGVGDVSCGLRSSIWTAVRGGS